MSRDVFLGILSSNDGRSENRVGWSQTRGDGQTGEEVEFWYKGINEPSGDEPPLRER